jgi:hypothetical protein
MAAHAGCCRQKLADTPHLGAPLPYVYVTFNSAARIDNQSNLVILTLALFPAVLEE